jgi:hypothetical protein
MLKIAKSIDDDATDDVAFCLQEVDFAIVISGFSLYSVDQDDLSPYQVKIAKENMNKGYVYDLVSQKLIKQH